MSLQAWAENNFQVLERCMNGAFGGKLHSDRKSALATFLNSGVPTPRDEEWRYSDFRELGEREYRLPEGAPAIPESELAQVAGDAALRVVLVNGVFHQTLSRITANHVAITPLADILHGKDTDTRIAAAFNSTKSLHQRPMNSLNYALMSGGAAVVVSGESKQPIEVVHISTASDSPTVHAPRLIVVIEPNAAATIVERFISLGYKDRFVCAVTEFKIGANADCDYYATTKSGDEVIHYHSLQAEIERDARMRTHLFPLFGKLVRNEVNYNLIGSNSHSTINGLSVISGTQHVDNSTVIRHAEPHCESSELFKGIYNDKARGVFQGTIIVEKGAQKTNAFQSNQALLLSKEASIDSKPQLKIWADDVKCTHGATVGELDRDALFYLRARGISREAAAALLTEAFAGEVLSGVRVESLRAELRNDFYTKLRIDTPE